MHMHIYIYCMKVEERDGVWGRLVGGGKGEGTKPEVDIVKAYDIRIFLQSNTAQ